MEITRERLDHDIVSLQAQKEDLVAQVNMVLGALKYAQLIREGLDLPEPAKPVPADAPTDTPPSSVVD